MAAWYSWATQVLSGIGAPVNQTNYDTLWKWSKKESGEIPLSNGQILNNPLATEWKWPGSTNGNDVGVQSYPDISSGALATIATLTSGKYPNIIGEFKNSTLSNSWGSAARYELETWAHGPNGAHGTHYPDFLGGTATAPTPGSDGFNIPNPVQDALNAALGPVGSAIHDAAGKAGWAALVGVGALLMLAGLALIAVTALQSAPAPVRKLAAAASNLTPQGRAVSVARATTPKATPAKVEPTPGALAVARAKKTRGARLGPEEREELSGHPPGYVPG